MGRTIKYIVLCLAIVVAAGSYTWLSLAYWKGFDTDLTKRQQELTHLKDVALHGTTQQSRLIAIRSLDGTVQHRDELCSSNPLFAWQSVIITPIKDGLEKCRRKVKTLDKVAVPLHDLRSYLDFAAGLQASLTPLKTPQALLPSGWSEKGLKPAQQAESAIKALPASGDAKRLQTSAEKTTARITAGWKQLIAADKAKDVQKFVGASSSLTHAYADLMGLADTADATIQTKVAATTAAASDL